MNNTEFIASVIVPVYNTEKYIEKCIESLLLQSVGFQRIQLVLVNDGSTDNSLQICQRYDSMYTNVTLINQTNQGVSAARNAGLNAALGKFIFFLDGDDSISDSTIENVIAEFEANYDNTDLYTYPISKYDIEGNLLPYEHFRFKYMEEKGIYSIVDNPYLCQTTMNICVKRESILNLKFDTRMSIHEDQKFINQLITGKSTIGFCQDAEYRYLSHPDSVMSNSTNVFELLEPTLLYYTELFDSYTEIPKYIQAMYLNDLNWKLRGNVLYPYHYSKEEFARVVSTISDLLKRVDTDIIMNFPEMDNFHRIYWMGIRDKNEIVFCGDENALRLFSEGEQIYSRAWMELVLNRVVFYQSKVRMMCFAKSPVFSFTDKPTFFLCINKKEEGEYEKELEISCYESAFGYYGTRTKVSTFWAVDFELELDGLRDLEINVEVEGIRYNTFYFFMDNCPFMQEYGLTTFMQQNHLVRFKNNKFYFYEIDDTDRILLLEKNNEHVKDYSIEMYGMRKRAMNFPKQKPIWLYYDCKGVTYDNAYLQFMHDIKIEDGIERYYIDANDAVKSNLFDDVTPERVVEFGSMKHKMLYMNADIIVTAFIEYNNVSPFCPEERQYLKDFETYRTVYLQHGILHASVPWKYTPEKLRIDKLVVSSYYEVENFAQKYHFQTTDFIQAGMPRFQMMNKNHPGTNRILFAPSWRSYLVHMSEQNNWITDDERFLKSNYYKQIVAFLKSNRLQDLLEEYDLYLDFKLHPIFAAYRKYFDVSNARISVNGDVVRQEQYSYFITDFSSYVFDYAFLGRKIMYFVPDLQEFEAGMNAYRELDLPFEKAFGKLASGSEEAVEVLKEVVTSDEAGYGKFIKRMHEFFLPFDDSCGCIYRETLTLMNS